MRDVAVIGVGMQKWGELWEKSTRDIFVESALTAMDDCGVDKLDAMYVGSMSPGIFAAQEHIGSLLADYLGQSSIPATRVESACASGGLAFRSAFMDVASWDERRRPGGRCREDDRYQRQGMQHTRWPPPADMQWEGMSGVTFPGLYAMMAVAHMDKYGTTREQLAAVAVKNHHNGSMNARAQFPMEITVEGVINSVKVADPLNILDCSPITDGAAAVILVPADHGEGLQEARHESASVVVTPRTPSPCMTVRISPRLKAVTAAADRAYKMAGKGPKDIDLAEVHDCFTIAEIMVHGEPWFLRAGQGRTRGREWRDRHRRSHPGQRQRRAQVQGTSRSARRGLLRSSRSPSSFAESRAIDRSRTLAWA